MIHIIANWKMNKNKNESVDFFRQFMLFSKTHTLSCSVCIAPPAIYVPLLADKFNSISLVAQNISDQDFGAYTGEISASMFSQYVNYAIIGHSERRNHFNETSSILYQKLLMCFKYDIKPIFCIGENVSQRKSGNYLQIIKNQLKSIMTLSENNINNIMIAYEPVWAIGTGDTATPDQVEEVHSFIRSIISQKIGANKSSSVPILYGGSCNSDNAEVLLNQNNVNGLLIGGASLDCSHFIQIIKIANQLS